MNNNDLSTHANNLGVSFLESGDLRSALDRFGCALRCTMGDLESAQPGSSSMTSLSLGTSVADFGSSSSSAASSEISPETSKFRVVSERRTSSSPPSSTTFAYTRAINLIPCPTAYSPDALINSTIVSAIIIFNLSIVYHLKGLEGGSGSISSMRLRKARALYQKSQNLLIDAGVPLGATGNPVIDVLSMALFNNLAHVAFELSSYEESRQFFDFLIRFALTVVPSKYGDAFVAALLDQQKSSFLLNAIILQVPKLAPAA